MTLRQVFLLLAILSIHSILIGQNKIDHRIYDTEFGRFDLWIYGDQVSGTYQIKPKNIIGSVYGSMKENEIQGRWKDPDGEGDIILLLEEEMKLFTANYRSDKEPDNWYIDQWHGVLQNLPVSSCSDSIYLLLKPFIGEWNEYKIDDSGDREFIGTLSVSFTNQNCTIQQKYFNQDSSFSYYTHGVVNPSSGFWEETYTFSTGTTSKYQWIVDDGEMVQRKIGGMTKVDHQYQLRFTELNKNGYLLLQEKSFDGGRTWKVSGKTRVEKRD